MWCAEAQPCLRHPSTGSGGNRQRDPEVGDHRPPVVQEDVLRLDVAMDHAVAVRVVECVSHFARDAHRFVHTELRLAVELRTQRLALDVRHHVKEEAVCRARIK